MDVSVIHTVGIGFIIGNIPGAIIGGILGGIGGVTFSDAYQRVVDYHPNEWNVLQFNVF